MSEIPATFERYRPHPWHGLDVGRDPPESVNAYVEITPFDAVKYEIDKRTGYLRVDRPQRTSSLPPTLYGFIPRTLCATHVAALTTDAERGDGDPLDICVFSERPITRAEVVLDVRVVGGLRQIDHGEADDKIVAVLHDDPLWGDVKEIADLPESMLNRLRHYFATYKLTPGRDAPVVVQATYDATHAMAVVRASVQDYEERFGKQEG